MTREWGGFLPVLALAVVGGLALVLRWAFGRGGSVVARPGRRGPSSDYGLLVAVAAPKTAEEGERLRVRLERAGVRATLADTAEGLRIMVFTQDAARARNLLSSVDGD